MAALKVNHWNLNLYFDLAKDLVQNQNEQRVNFATAPEFDIHAM